MTTITIKTTTISHLRSKNSTFSRTTYLFTSVPRHGTLAITGVVDLLWNYDTFRTMWPLVLFSGKIASVLLNDYSLGRYVINLRNILRPPQTKICMFILRKSSKNRWILVRGTSKVTHNRKNLQMYLDESPGARFVRGRQETVNYLLHSIMNSDVYSQVSLWTRNKILGFRIFRTPMVNLVCIGNCVDEWRG